MKIENGIKVNTETNILLENNCPKNVDNIFNNVCPAVILANNLTPKETALAIYDTNSIRTNNGTNAKGVPEGTKKAKKCNLCLYRAKIVTPMKIVKLSPIDTIIDVATV
jgi:hypothetical protein